MIIHKVKVFPSKIHLPKKKQLAWKIAEIASDNAKLNKDSIEMVINRIIEPSETIKIIDKVSKETVQKIANEIVKGPITISSIGPLSKLENIDKIQSRIN